MGISEKSTAEKEVIRCDWAVKSKYHLTSFSFYPRQQH